MKQSTQQHSRGAAQTPVSQSFLHRWEQSWGTLSAKPLLLTVEVMDQKLLPPGGFLEMQNFRSYPRPLTWTLPFSLLPQACACILKFEKRCLRNSCHLKLREASKPLVQLGVSLHLQNQPQSHAGDWQLWGQGYNKSHIIMHKCSSLPIKKVQKILSYSYST